MRKILKKSISILLATLCAFNLTVVSFAEDTVTSGTCGANASWSFDEVTGTLTISGEGDIEDFSSKDEQSWEDIDLQVTRVVVENGITRIGNYAFDSMFNIIELSIPEGLTSIGDRAFSYISVTNIIIPNSVISLGNQVFYGSNVTELSIGIGLASIGEEAFSFCNDITNIKVDDENQHFSSDDSGVLFNKTKTDLIKYPRKSAKTEYAIPDGVINICDSAFDTAWNLKSIAIPYGVRTIDRFAFCSCIALTSIHIPESVMMIGEHAFNNCEVLEGIVIPEGVEIIGEQAFRDCDNLKNVVISESVTSIGKWAFDGSEVVKFSVDSNNLNYSSDEYGVLFDKNKTELIRFICGSETKSYSIPDTVQIIGSSSFCNCKNLTSVIIPDSVTSVGLNAFLLCPNLTTTYYTGTEEQWNTISIGANNAELTKNIVFNYKETITGACGENATWSFDEINGKLTISGYGEMNDYAINNNSMPYYYPVPWADYKPYVKSIEISSGITYIGMNTFRDCTEVTELVIPEGVSQIGISAFGGCKKLYSVKIPESITVVDSSAFLNSQEIKEVYYAGSFEKWNSISFTSKESNPLRYEGKLYFDGILVENLIIPDGIKEISENVFSNNSCITSVTIPESVESIGENAFISSDKLEVTYYTGTEGQWNEIAIASGNDALTRNVVFNYGKPTDVCGESAMWAFDEASGTLTISGTGTISDYSGWSDIASIVTYIEIGNGITAVGENAFNGFDKLKEVYLAESVTELGDDAFKGCSKLATVTALSDDLSFINAFSGNDSRLFFVARAESESYSALKSAGHTVNGISTDKEKDGHKVLSFDGKTTIYQNLDYNYISNLIADNSYAYYLYFDKITFEGIAPDTIIIDEENIDKAEEYFTLNEVYISVSVNGKTVSLPELVELLQKEDADGIISFEQKDEPTIFEIISSFFNEVFEDFVEEANRVIITVINAIKRLFKR